MINNQSFVLPNKKKYFLWKSKIVKLTLISAFILITILLFAAYQASIIFADKTKFNDLKHKSAEIHYKIHKLISENNLLNRSKTTLDSMHLYNNTNIDFYTKHIQNSINDIAYYYNLKGPIQVSLTSKEHMENKISKIKVEISLSSKDDESIMKFYDTLTKSLNGFVKVQEFNIMSEKKSKNKKYSVTNTIISCRINLDWYILLSPASNQTYYYNDSIYPTNSNVAIEDLYRVSLWEGSIMLQ